MSETNGGTRIREVGVVMVPVADQDRAIEFYVEKLGFELRGDTPYGDGQRWVEVAPAGAATAISLVPPMGDMAPPVESRIGLASDDVDGAHAELKARGVDVDPQIMRMGDPVPPMFWMRDLDGNRLLVAQRG